MSEVYNEPGRDNPLTYLLERAQNSAVRGLMITLPGRIAAFDPETQRAQVECAINLLINGSPAPIPVIINVPVQFSGDNEWYFYHQITPGETEGLVHFSQRAIETWKQQGGRTTPVDARMFSAQDACFAPGYRSDPGVIPNFVNDGCGLSNYEGTVKLALNGDGFALTVGSQVLTLDSTGLKHNGTNVGDTHVHAQANDSSNDSEANTDGPQ